jgi:hypothetical protein
MRSGIIKVVQRNHRPIARESSTMTIATTTEPGMGSAAPEPELTDPVDAVRRWLEENWDPELTVADWWERLGLAGWSAPTLPVE